MGTLPAPTLMRRFDLVAFDLYGTLLDISWSTATHQRQDELHPVRERLAAVDARLSELSSSAAQAAPPITPEAWAQWCQGLEKIGVGAGHVEAASREAPAFIDGAIKRLEALRRSTARHLENLQVFQTAMAALADRPMMDLGPLQKQLPASRQALEKLRHLVSEEQAHLAEDRRLQAALTERSEQLRTLAILALQHLDDRCPVCDQEYDKKATRKRLEGLATGADKVSATARERKTLSDLLTALAAKEKEAGATELALRSAEQTANERQIAMAGLTARLAELGIESRDDSARDSSLRKAIGEGSILLRRVSESQAVGESLAASLVRLSAVAGIDEHRREADALRIEIAEGEKEILARNQTGDRAQQVIEALREAASAVVEERLREILLLPPSSRLSERSTRKVIPSQPGPTSAAR